jgi:hypothetical protein
MDGQEEELCDDCGKKKEVVSCPVCGLLVCDDCWELHCDSCDYASGGGEADWLGPY